MKKYLTTVKNAGVALLIAFIFLGIADLFGIDRNAKRYISIGIGTILGWYLIDIIRIKRSR